MTIRPKLKVPVIWFAPTDAAMRPTGEQVGQGRDIVRTIRALRAQGIVSQDRLSEAFVKRFDDLTKGGTRPKGIGVIVIHEHGGVPNSGQEQGLKTTEEVGANDLTLIGPDERQYFGLYTGNGKMIAPKLH